MKIADHWLGCGSWLVCGGMRVDVGESEDVAGAQDLMIRFKYRDFFTQVRLPFGKLSELVERVGYRLVRKEEEKPDVF